MSQQDVMMQEMMGGMYGPNMYSRYQNKRLPMPGYVGTPTDSQGNSIAPPPGTTINSTPVAATPTAAAPLNSTQNWWNELSQPSAMNPSGNAAVGMSDWGAFMGPQGAVDRASPSFLQPGMQGSQDAGNVWNSGFGKQQLAQQGATDGAAAAPAQGSMTNALSLLANPAKVVTPGADVPQAQPTGQGPSVLAQFLANNKGGKGAGGYDNSGFFGTLNALKGT